MLLKTNEELWKEYLLARKTMAETSLKKKNPNPEAQLVGHS